MALTAGIVVHLVGWFLLGPITDEVYANMSGALKVFLALVYPNVGFNWGVRVLAQKEADAAGIQFSNLFVKTFPNDPITMGAVLIIFIANIFFFGFLTWYLDSIKPGPFGVAKKWNFLFTKSYWTSSKTGQIQPENRHELDEESKKFFEEEPKNIFAGIVVNGLRKIFKGLMNSTVLAVDSVNFKAYKGQITALLGHNGAGKTTTMNMLTGMISPSYGSALIDGSDIKTEMNLIRKSLGLCPQHNMLFMDLTVEEHLTFFAMLKGCNMKEAKEQSLYYIEKLNLLPKRRILAEKLSGGMKRKVHLGIALIGNSSVVMLDEPTSGNFEVKILTLL